MISVFVHAGFMPGRTLLEQDEHVMMTIRSLDHARPTPRCILGQVCLWPLCVASIAASDPHRLRVRC